MGNESIIYFAFFAIPVIGLYFFNKAERRAEALERVNETLKEEISRRQEAEAELTKRAAALEWTNHKLEHMAQYDLLTGLYNRSLLEEVLMQALSRARNMGTMVALLFLDLDRFKNINDTLGHAAGDALLKAVGGRLLGCTRTKDVVARLGGDEFTILLEGVPEVKQAGQVAERILTALGQPFDLEGQEGYVDASIGIAVHPFDGHDIGTLLKHADIAMYRAKEQGGGRYQFYTPDMNARSLERLNMESGLRRAIERNEFVLEYQPKVELSTRRIVGAEALVRWEHREWGVVSPSAFIPLAEESGLIDRIGEWVLREACFQHVGWQARGLPLFHIAVNVSARQFRNGLPTIIHTILEETGLDPRWIELEITEGALLEDTDYCMDVLQQLKALGLKISVDDFGTGYSSLSYLKRFPLDSLKIDQSFVQDIPYDVNDTSIAAAIIDIAHNLGLKVVAEGVETDEQLNFLLSHECDEGQGYLFGRPVNSEEFERMLCQTETACVETALFADNRSLSTFR